MNMKITDAYDKHCPIRGSMCGADHCMAWRWIQPLCLSATTYPQNKEHLYLNAGINGTIPAELATPDAFDPPFGAEWQHKETVFDSLSGWKAHWERDSDPNRLGQCALIYRRDAQMIGMLDDINSTLTDISNK